MALAGSAELPDQQDAGTQSPGPMSKLQMEWLIQVLERLPTNCVFVCMSVNTEWQTAAKYVAKHRDTLVLCRYGRRIDDQMDWFMKFFPNSDFFTIIFKDDIVESVVKSLKVMVKVENLLIDDWPKGGPFETPITSHFVPLLETNSPHLKTLSFNQSLLIDGPQVVYPELVNLHCSRLEGKDVAAACPVLQVLLLIVNYQPYDYNLPDVKMPHLKKLVVVNSDEFFCSDKFVKNNADTMREVDIHNDDLPEGLTFPLMDSLSCGSLDADTGRGCMAVMKLTLRHQKSGSLQFMPLHQLVKLDMYLYPKKMDDVVQFCQSVTEMRHLTHLIVKLCRTPKQSTDNLPVDLPDIFRDKDELEVTDIRWLLKRQSESSKRQWMKSLTQCSQLQHMDTEIGLNVTDEDLESLSHLDHLKTIETRVAPGVGVDSVLRFLRGSSRSSIRRFVIFGLDKDALALIKQEIRVMAQERGVKFKKWGEEFDLSDRQKRFLKNPHD